MTDEKSDIERELGDEIVLKRRIETRIENLELGDRPRFRKIVGWIIIGLSLAAGWKLLGRRSIELKEHTAQVGRDAEFSASKLRAARDEAHRCLSDAEIALVASALREIPDEESAARSKAILLFASTDGAEGQSSNGGEKSLDSQLTLSDWNGSEAQPDLSENRDLKVKVGGAPIYGTLVIRQNQMQLMRWVKKLSPKKCSELMCSVMPELVCQCSTNKDCSASKL